MNKKEYKLLVEGWRNILSEVDDQDDDDVTGDVVVNYDYDDHNSEDSRIHSEEESDRLEQNLDYVEDQIGQIRSVDEEKEEMINRFCDMFGLGRDELEGFIENQAFSSDTEFDGADFDERLDAEDFDG